jgi:hypothetical protein
MKYEKAKEFFYSDGSFRDIYAFNTTLEELDKFLNYVRPRLRKNSFSIGDKEVLLPESYKEILNEVAKRNTNSILRIPVGESELNCHFFDSSELELDLQPKDFQTEGEWVELNNFLRGLAEAMNKEIVMTPENTPEEIFIRYEPGAEPFAGGDAVR